jgi:hypothetical protein
MKRTREKKVLAWMTVAILSLCFASLCSARVDPETVISLWLFDAEDNNVVPDLSGNGYDGILNGKPEFEEGKFGLALVYDGGDDFVEIPNLHENIKDGFTVTFWINKPDQDLDNRWLVGSYSGWEDGATSFLIWKDEDPGHGNATYFCVQGKNDRGCCSSQDLGFDSWHHVAATYDKAQVRLYFDGVQAGSSAFSEEVSVASGKWYVGYAPGNQIMGMMDEVAFFNVALPVDDIKEIMNDGLEAALGITAVDLSGKLVTTWGDIKE